MQTMEGKVILFGIQKFKSGNYKVVEPMLSDTIRDDLTVDYGRPITKSIDRETAYSIANALNNVLTEYNNRNPIF